MFGLGFSIIGLIPSIACVHISVRRLIVSLNTKSTALYWSSLCRLVGHLPLCGGYVQSHCLGRPRLIHFQWATCAFFLTFIALAMADLGSAMPTSGGLYYWTYKYSSPRWRTLLCWIVGCKNISVTLIRYPTGGLSNLTLSFRHEHHHQRCLHGLC